VGRATYARNQTIVVAGKMKFLVAKHAARRVRVYVGIMASTWHPPGLASSVSKSNRLIVDAAMKLRDER
jgi:hypothetical protein